MSAEAMTATTGETLYQLSRQRLDLSHVSRLLQAQMWAIRFLVEVRKRKNYLKRLTISDRAMYQGAFSLATMEIRK